MCQSTGCRVEARDHLIARDEMGHRAVGIDADDAEAPRVLVSDDGPLPVPANGGGPRRQRDRAPVEIPGQVAEASVGFPAVEI